ncbi:MAG: YIP1 family protein [Actinobacteria bacterium]|nr:YIP1 family protein [Actinomycetota bacterium]
MNVAAEPAPSQQRDWWLRALAVFGSPRAVFAAMRDDSREAAGARQEPITAIVFLAGMAGVLSTTIAGRLLDDPAFDGLSVAVWAFLGGAMYGLLVYWLGGALVYGSGSLLGAQWSYRQARHVLAFAAGPLVLALILVWPVRLAVYGSDVFRSGGHDTGTGDAIFEALTLGFVCWALALLVIAMRAVHGWSLPRAAGAVALASIPAALFVGLNLLR